MGATYPLLSAYVARRSDAPTRWVGLLYGLNTAGAVVGTVLSGFVLVAHLGLAGSNYLLVAINVSVGAVAILRARRTGAAATAAPSASAETAPLYGLILGIFLANGLFNLATLTLLLPGQSKGKYVGHSGWWDFRPPSAPC